MQISKSKQSKTKQSKIPRRDISIMKCNTFVTSTHGRNLNECQQFIENGISYAVHIFVECTIVANLENWSITATESKWNIQKIQPNDVNFMNFIFINNSKNYNLMNTN